VLTVANVEEVNVELVWEPPWNQGMMSESGRLELGLM
jgi:metal-sulfur cluster biosynthetic enzyme